jgi:hypothetical protein
VYQKEKMKFADGNGRPSKQDAWSVEKYAIIDAPYCVRSEEYL